MKKIFGNFKTEIYVLLGVFVAYKLWPVISSLLGVAGTLSETVGLAAAGATAGLQTSSQLAIDKSKLHTLSPGATEAEILALRSDARALASALGQLTGNWGATSFIKDQQTAFSILKKYSRLLLHNNHPYDQKTLLGTKGETKTSAKRARNTSVLQPFYDEYTGGNSLKADALNWISGSAYKPYLGWIL